MCESVFVYECVCVCVCFFFFVCVCVCVCGVCEEYYVYIIFLRLMCMSAGLIL